MLLLWVQRPHLEEQVLGEYNLSKKKKNWGFVSWSGLLDTFQDSRYQKKLPFCSGLGFKIILFLKVSLRPSRVLSIPLQPRSACLKGSAGSGLWEGLRPPFLFLCLPPWGQDSGLSLYHSAVTCVSQCPEEEPAQGWVRLPGNLCLKQAFNRDTLLNSNQEKILSSSRVSIYRTQLLKLKGSIRLKFNLLYTVIYSTK